MRVQTCDEKVDARAGKNSSVSYETAAANADIGLLPTTSPRRAAVGLPGLNIPVSRARDPLRDTVDGGSQPPVGVRKRLLSRPVI